MRRGATLVEVVVVCVLFTGLAALTVRTVRAVSELRAHLVRSSDLLDSVRAARLVLGRDLRHATPGRDWEVTPDSLSLRSYRGTAVVCAQLAPDRLAVSYRGDRLPQPAGDSVLLWSAADSATVFALTAVSAHAGCDSLAGTGQRWTLDRAVADGPVLARLFERGSYHLAGSALRYRTGGGGRQPLTPEVFSTGRSRWEIDSLSLSLRLESADVGDTASWGGFLSWRR